MNKRQGKRRPPEQIIRKLREADTILVQTGLRLPAENDTTQANHG